MLRSCLKLSLSVDNPSCLWGRVVRGLGGDAETAVQYDRLLAQMNLFYHDVTQDLRKLKPTSLEEGQVCVVYWSVMKSWCRAVVESIIMGSVSCQARCLLVDHGERLVVSSDQIRVAVQNFLQLPFWVRRFHLAGLKPATLRVSVFEEMAELISSSQWDSSATLYLHNLLQASTRTEAVLLESESDSTSIQLYLTVGNVKICVNDDLVVKKFAFYIRESADGGQLDEVDQCPVMLSSSILKQLSPSRTLCTAANMPTAQTQPPPGKRTDSHMFQHMHGHQQEELTDCQPEETASATITCTGLDGHASTTTTQLVVHFDPRRSGILVHSALPVEPCSCLDDAPVTDTLRRVLQRKQYNSLSPADRYSWPAVARGCNTVIVSPNADQPLSYLAPLLTHILLNSIFTSLTSSAGPIAVLLCPGWEKVQAVYDLLDETKVAHTLHPFVVLLGIGKDEAKTIRIPKNCLLLVTTPFSLVRMLSCHCFLFLRLYHLVLDEADQLFTLAPEQMATILQHYQKVTSSEQKASCPQQLIAVAKRWTSHMEGLLANHMPHPCIVLTVPEEAALYGNIHQIILMTLESSKISVLLSSLDFNPDVGQKTLIVANSAQEVENVFKAVSNKSAFCLMTHEGLTHDFDFVIQQWRKDIGPGTHLILVTTNECLRCFGIRDATCVVHFSFPTSPKVFGSRLFCMAENFRDLSEWVPSLDQSESSLSLTKSVLLISERNARHVVGVLRFLIRTNAPLPSELLSFAQGVHTAREDQKTTRPLCKHLKSFGVCRDSSVCPDRHRFIPRLDQSVLPASGVIEVVPLYIKTASVFYGCIIRKEEGGFHSLLSEMTSYYADKKPGAKELLEGELYAVEEDEVFYRVKILSVPDKGDRLFFSVLARFIDVGKEEEVKSHQILQLPEQFHSLPGQAVEIILCRVKPVDKETEWHPKVPCPPSHFYTQTHKHITTYSVMGFLLIDPQVRVSQVPGMKTVINEYNVQSEILKTGMGVSNPEHLNLLRALWQKSNTDSYKEAGNTSG
uniref:RNA helicase n=1 Tax=Labrus bergylta TaxID=56723 RepID=A0A3Q3EIQ7_9LABR